MVANAMQARGPCQGTVVYKTGGQTGYTIALVRFKSKRKVWSPTEFDLHDTRGQKHPAKIQVANN